MGITGTNGKTTTAWLLEQALRAASVRAGRLGTLGYSFELDREDSQLTTPEADTISRYLARVRDRGGSHFVAEVSSHALIQNRVDALSFEVAAFCNLSQDHLDFHSTMMEYGEAKARLFLELQPKVSVINVDDNFGQALAERISGRVIRVSSHTPADTALSDAVFPERLTRGAAGIDAQVRVPSGSVRLRSSMVGAHNVENLLMVLGIVDALGVDVSRAALGLAGAKSVPGRLERCDSEEDDLTVLVDYAHTPDALMRALTAAREATTGKLICVFGCGGDRDASKRAPMGEAVGSLADIGIVTNDNPRSENPEEIAEAVLSALRSRGSVSELCLDRAAAISQAISQATPGDCILIAGKGHENYQIIGDQRRHFDDREEARRALVERRRGSD